MFSVLNIQLHTYSRNADHSPFTRLQLQSVISSKGGISSFSDPSPRHSTSFTVVASVIELGLGGLFGGI